MMVDLWSLLLIQSVAQHLSFVRLVQRSIMSSQHFKASSHVWQLELAWINHALTVRAVRVDWVQTSWARLSWLLEVIPPGLNVHLDMILWLIICSGVLVLSVSPNSPQFMWSPVFRSGSVKKLEQPKKKTQLKLFASVTKNLQWSSGETL